MTAWNKTLLDEFATAMPVEDVEEHSEYSPLPDVPRIAQKTIFESAFAIDTHALQMESRTNDAKMRE